MRYLQFGGRDEKARERYTLIYLALANSQKKNTLADLRTITDLTRALRTVGEPAAEKLGRIQLFELKDGLTDDTGLVALEGIEHKMLKQLIESTPWSSGMAEEVVELNDWIERAPKDRPRVADGPADADEDQAAGGSAVETTEVVRA